MTYNWSEILFSFYGGGVIGVLLGFAGAVLYLQAIHAAAEESDTIMRQVGLSEMPALTDQYREMLNNWGVQCEDYHAECYKCQAWRLYDATKFCPSDNTVQAAVLDAQRRA